MTRFLISALSLTLLLAACDSAPYQVDKSEVPGSLGPMAYLDSQCGDWYAISMNHTIDGDMMTVYWSIDYDLQNNGLCPSTAQYIYGALIVADAGDCGLGGWPEMLALPDTTSYDPVTCKYTFDATFNWEDRFPDGVFWLLPGLKTNCGGGDHFIWGDCTEVDADPPPAGGGKGNPHG